MANFVPIGNIDTQNSAGFLLDNKGASGETVIVDLPLSEAKTNTDVFLPSEFSSFKFPLNTNKVVSGDVMRVRNSYIAFADAYSGTPPTAIPYAQIWINSGLMYVCYLAAKQYEDKLVIRYEATYTGSNIVLQLWEVSLFKDGVVQIVNGRSRYSFGYAIGVGDGVNPNVIDKTINTNRSIVIVPTTDFSSRTVYFDSSYIVKEPSEDDVPLPPKNVTLKESTENTLTFSIEMEDDIKRVGVEIQEIETGKTVFSGGLNETTITLTNLTPNTVHAFNLYFLGVYGVKTQAIVIRGKTNNIVLPDNTIGEYSSVTASLMMTNPHGSNGETVLLDGEFDDVSRSATQLDFQFPFYGVNKSVNICTNSFLSFGNNSIIYGNFTLRSPAGIYINAHDVIGAWIAEKLLVSGKAWMVRSEARNRTESTRQIWEATLFSDGVIQLVMGYVPVPDRKISLVTNSIEATGKIFDNPLSGESYVFIPKPNPADGYDIYKGSYVLTTQSAKPKVSIVSNSKPKLSPKEQYRESTLVFNFDKNVTEWIVRAGGDSHETGYIADRGGAVTANTNINAIIDYTELPNEGVNKINIYGKGEDGQWTEYER